MVLKQIISRNIQSHKEVVLDFPPTGFIMLMGGNSNGKSVIVRATRDMLCNNIKKPQTRYDLVTKQASYGEMIYVREDDVILTMHLTREAASTYISLQYPGKEPITRYLADKSYMELVRAFGWNTAEDTGISLNISEGDDALFFYKTPLKTNCKVMQSASTDPVAEKVLEEFQKTSKDAKQFRDNAVANIRALQSALNQLTIQDTDALTIRRDKLMYYYRNLSKIYVPNLPEVKPVPNVSFVSLHRPSLPVIKYPRIFNVTCNLPNILPIVQEMQTLRERKCPTCGRGFDCDC